MNQSDFQSVTMTKGTETIDEGTSSKGPKMPFLERTMKVNSSLVVDSIKEAN